MMMMKWSHHPVPTAFLSSIMSSHHPTRSGGGSNRIEPPTMTWMAAVRDDDDDDVDRASPTSTTGACIATTSTAGRRLFSFVEARRIARGHGFDSREEFWEYSCPGAYRLPKDANLVWSEVGIKEDVSPSSCL